MVEHFIGNEEVMGSSPISSSCCQFTLAGQGASQGWLLSWFAVEKGSQELKKAVRQVVFVMVRVGFAHGVTKFFVC